MTVASGVLTVAGEVSMTTLDIGGTNVTSTAAELNYSDTGAAVGTVVASKVVTADANKDVASFRNITLTGELDAGSLDVSGDADIDGTLEADAITIGGTAIASVLSPVAGSGSIVTTGALNSGSITSGFGAINNGASAITTTGVGSFGSLDISGDIDVDGTTNLDVVDIDGAVDMASTLGVTGVVTANAGVVVDTMTLDGAALTATGDFTATVAGTVLVDAAGDIVLDAAGDDILLKSAGTHEGNINLASSNLTIKSIVSDKDIIFQGNDGGAGITALTLDMSAAGAATFNNDVTAFSDKRLKTDVTDIENALDKVQQMQGVYYRRNDVEDAKMQVGVLAQDMEQVLPEVVLTADDEMQTKSVDYGKITSVLIEAVKELSAKVEYLEGKKECSCGGDK